MKVKWQIMRFSFKYTLSIIKGDKKMKKLLMLTFVFVMIAAISANAMVGVNFNGNTIDFDNEPVIVSDRTMVPAEEFFNSTKIP